MGITVLTEDIPLIFASILVAYSFIRLVMTCFKRGKLSIFKYWSRFCFRFFFTAHCIFNVILNVRSAARLGQFFVLSPYFSHILLTISLAFLVMSLQDFVCYSSPETTFIKRNWIYLTLPFVVSLISSQAIDYFTSLQNDIRSMTIAKCVYQVIFLIFVLSLISFPALFFMNEVANNDFSCTLYWKISLARTFFIIEIFLLIFSCTFEIATSFTIFSRGPFLWLKSLKDPTFMMVCVTQDMIDWMLKWLYLDEDIISKPDEYENNRKKTNEY